MEFATPVLMSLAGPDGFTAISNMLSKPEPSTAWLLAAGFVGIVVLRRTRHGPIN